MILPNWGGLKLRAIIADEWAEMKIKYKEIQKQNMRKLKQSLKVRFTLIQGSNLVEGFNLSLRWGRSAKAHYVRRVSGQYI